MSDEFTIDSVSIYEVSPFNLGSMIKYSPRPGAIEEWEYKLKPGEHICEDCGGVTGYYYLLEALADPGHEDHDMLMEWVGGRFDPEAFDVATVDRSLKRVR